MSEKGYAGKIGNTGAQVVKAPYQGSKKGGKSIVRKGEDLGGGRDSTSVNKKK